VQAADPIRLRCQSDDPTSARRAEEGLQVHPPVPAPPGRLRSRCGGLDRFPAAAAPVAEGRGSPCFGRSPALRLAAGGPWDETGVARREIPSLCPILRQRDRRKDASSQRRTGRNVWTDRSVAGVVAPEL